MLLEHAKLHAESVVFQRRTDEKLAQVSDTLVEIGDKLNGLIGYVDGMRPPNKQ
jgi:hypothetical protein